MNTKAYIINFNKGGWNDPFNYKAFHDKLITANGILNWWHHLDCTYIVIVDSNISAKNIAEYLYQIAPSKEIFVCELNLKNHNGWLSQEAWDWINKNMY